MTNKTETELEEKFKSDDGYSEIETDENPKKQPKRKADKIDAAASKSGEKIAEDEVIEEEVTEVAPTVASIFEGEDLSEEFVKKAELVFEAAISEQVEARVAAVCAELEEAASELAEEAIAEGIESIVEKLDQYLDYMAEEWFEENRLAVENGIQVEMAESFMEGLRSLFVEHNVALDDETVDVVAELEEEVASLKAQINESVEENMELNKKITAFTAEKVFAESVEGLSISQVERMRVLSRKLVVEDLEEYASDLKTLRESFFSKKNTGESEQLALTESASDQEDEIITESTGIKKPQAESVAALMAYLANKK